MRTTLLSALAAAAVALVASAAPSWAGPGPSGSTESKTNVVTCNGTTGPGAGGVNVYAGGNGAYVGSGGIEVCSDDDTAVDGRVIVSLTGYVAADGDDSNPDEIQGFARLDSGGPECSGDDDPKIDTDNDSTYGKGSPCG